jgi:hypothetical protein
MTLTGSSRGAAPAAEWTVAYQPAEGEGQRRSQRRAQNMHALRHCNLR